MSQIKKKFILDQAIDESKILLSNNGALVAKNAAGSADVALLKLDADDKLQLLVLPEVASDASSNNQLVRKSQVDGLIGGVEEDLTALEGRVEDLEDKLGQPNGIATLDASGLVPSSQLPSYVDDVLEFANLAAFPATGETGKIYVALDTNKTYRWSGSVYIYITSGAVDSVNGQTGVVVLESDDIALQAAVRSETDVQGALEKLDTDLGAAESAISTAQGDIDALEGRMDTAEGDIDALEGRMDTAEGDIDAVEGRLDTAEGDIDALEGRADSLESFAVDFAKEKFVLSAQNVEDGYVDLAALAIANSVVVFVDRLALHKDDDFSLSTIGGVTRITFLLAGEEELAASDVIRITYAKKPAYLV